MNQTATKHAEELLTAALKELESSKGSVQAGVQRLLRASRLLDDENTAIWCEIQLGNATYTNPLRNAIKDYS
jgi:hypothetical protein